MYLPVSLTLSKTLLTNFGDCFGDFLGDGLGDRLGDALGEPICGHFLIFSDSFLANGVTKEDFLLKVLN